VIAPIVFTHAHAQVAPVNNRFPFSNTFKLPMALATALVTGGRDRDRRHHHHHGIIHRGPKTQANG
jgi:hypothetical protein